MDPITAIASAFSFGKQWLSGKSREAKLTKELEYKKVSELAKTRRELIKRSTGRLRLFTLIVLTAPFVAPILPWVSVADVQAYFNSAISAVPDWWVTSLQAAFAAIWAGAEVRNLNAGRDERRLAEKESEVESERIRSQSPKHGG